MTLAQISLNSIYSAMAVYALAMLAFAGDVARRLQPDRIAMGASTVPHAPATQAEQPLEQTDPLGRVALSLTVLAVGLHAAGLVTRSLDAGRVPWGNMYEFSTALSLAGALAFLVFLHTHDVRAAGPWVLAAVLLTLGLSVTVFYTAAGALVPALDSYWLVIHVAAAITSAGIFTVGAATAVLYLIRRRAERRDGPAVNGYAGLLPTTERLDTFLWRIHTLGFPIWTFAVVAGAIWAENAWGRYWGWDPKETWAFITWVIYAAYLHARSTAGWRGSAAAWIVLAGYAAFTFNYYGVNIWITGLHSYAGM